MTFLLRLTKKLTGGNGADDPEESKSATYKPSEKEVKDKEMAQKKVNVSTIYNSSEDYKPVSQNTSKSSSKKNEKLIKQFKSLTEEAVVCDLQQLKQLAWSGIPPEVRGATWKILLEYVPLNREKRDSALAKKREEYDKMREFYKDETESDYISEKERKVFKVIEADVFRTQPEYPLFHVKSIQTMLKRILTIWHIRHPASGYVQGMNDLATPILAALLLEYIEIDYSTFNVPADFETVLTTEDFRALEADVYHCLCKTLEGIQDNYTNSQPGTHRSVNRIRELLKRIDNELLEHFETNEINLMQIVIRWVFCLLVREFPLKLGMRLFDTYMSDEEGFTTLHCYVCLVLLTKWSAKIKKMPFNDMMIFLQNLPTKDWGEEDINMIVAEAYVYKSMFESDTKVISAKNSVK